ncbi:unnamed protein product [Heterobilharzia americana]|nr:unnamed protein product [Heterobilharzia americana]
MRFPAVKQDKSTYLQNWKTIRSESCSLIYLILCAGGLPKARKSVSTSKKSASDLSYGLVRDLIECKLILCSIAHISELVLDKRYINIG